MNTILALTNAIDKSNLNHLDYYISPHKLQYKMSNFLRRRQNNREPKPPPQRRKQQQIATINLGSKKCNQPGHWQINTASVPIIAKRKRKRPNSSSKNTASINIPSPRIISESSSTEALLNEDGNASSSVVIIKPEQEQEQEPSLMRLLYVPTFGGSVLVKRIEAKQSNTKLDDTTKTTTATTTAMKTALKKNKTLTTIDIAYNGTKKMIPPKKSSASKRRPSSASRSRSPRTTHSGATNMQSTMIQTSRQRPASAATKRTPHQYYLDTTHFDAADEGTTENKYHDEDITEINFNMYEDDFEEGYKKDYEQEDEQQAAILDRLYDILVPSSYTKIQPVQKKPWSTKSPRNILEAKQQQKFKIPFLVIGGQHPPQLKIPSTALSPRFQTDITHYEHLSGTVNRAQRKQQQHSKNITKNKKNNKKKISKQLSPRSICISTTQAVPSRVALRPTNNYRRPRSASSARTKRIQHPRRKNQGHAGNRSRMAHFVKLF